jgi:DNA-binding response OmpR family regulator/two-component sensor histidine kinase
MMAKILVIEDNEYLRNNIEEFLEMEEFQVASAEDGKVGIEKAKSFLPDLIISDVNMPFVDGFGVLEALNNDTETQNIPFIFLTVKKTLQDRRKGMNLGAADYLPKPFDLNELITVVNRMLNPDEAPEDAQEEELNELKSLAGFPVNRIIDEPLKKLEQLAELMKGDTAKVKTDEIPEIAGVIAENASRLRKDIIKVLHFYRVEGLKTNKQELDALKAFTTAGIVDKLELITKTIAERYERRADLFVHADEATLGLPEEFFEFCLGELVDNAFKFSSDEGLIQVTGTKQARFYTITILDEGAGMEATLVDHVQPYAKLTATGDGSKGLGLGLYNVKSLARLFGGSLNVQSEIGVGTVITLSIPLA